MKAAKPLGNKYIDNLSTIGEHLRNRRLELHLLQKEVAERISVTEDAVTLWENEQAVPQFNLMPRIIAFLGYNPIKVVTSTLGGKIKAYRILHGLSHRAMGKLVGVHATTIGSWERNECHPIGERKKKLDTLLQGK